MGFRKDSYAKVWSVKDNGRYSTCRITISRKNKTTNAYETEFTDGFVNFVGKAHELIHDKVIDENKGYSIKIISCDVTNVYTDQNGKVTYKPHYTIFDCEDGNATQAMTNAFANNPNVNNNKVKAEDFLETGVDDEELPFI